MDAVSVPLLQFLLLSIVEIIMIYEAYSFVSTLTLTGHMTS